MKTTLHGPALRLVLIAALLSGVLLLGTAGYWLIEEQTLFDSFFMALISLTTVGYSFEWELSQDGRIFTAILLIVGVTVVFASIGIISDVVLRLELEDYFGRRRTQGMLKNLENHYIVCGAGRVGRGVISELQRSGSRLVLIDNSAEKAAWAQEQEIPTLIADASLDQTLIEAGIKRAKGLVAAIGSDAENVYVTLSARVLNPNMLIAARSTNEQAEEKLRRAGASTVFTPYTFIGHRLVPATPACIELSGCSFGLPGNGSRSRDRASEGFRAQPCRRQDAGTVQLAATVRRDCARGDSAGRRNELQSGRIYRDPCGRRPDYDG